MVIVRNTFITDGGRHKLAAQLKETQARDPPERPRDDGPCRDINDVVIEQEVESASESKALMTRFCSDPHTREKGNRGKSTSGPRVAANCSRLSELMSSSSDDRCVLSSWAVALNRCRS
jgi:hypothetical protein